MKLQNGMGMNISLSHNPKNGFTWSNTQQVVKDGIVLEPIQLSSTPKTILTKSWHKLLEELIDLIPPSETYIITISKPEAELISLSVKL